MIDDDEQDESEPVFLANFDLTETQEANVLKLVKFLRANSLSIADLEFAIGTFKYVPIDRFFIDT